MRLTLSQQTQEEQREATWLRAVEGGNTTVQELSHVTGLSVRRIQERLKRARENRAEFEPDEGPGNELDEAVYLALTDDRDRERAGWYDLGSDETSHDGSGVAVLVGDHNGRRLRRNRLGTGEKRKTDDGEAKSEGRAVNDTDRAKGVVYVQT